MDRPSLAQFALTVAVLVPVGVMLGREAKRRFKPSDLREQAEQKAEADQAERVSEGRVRVVPAMPKPEWAKRLQRKVMGLGRLGDRELKRRTQ